MTDRTVVAEYQEVINGILYNTKEIHTDTAIIFTHDPVRTPEQTAARNKRLGEALASYARRLEQIMGFEWCMEHLACRDREAVTAVYADKGLEVPEYLQKYLS